MIKISRKESELVEKARQDLEKNRKNDSGYNTMNVNKALKEVFHGKCYICENNAVTSYQIDHLVPHRGNIDRKYDWNNLLLCCAHCNGTKLDGYDPILNCCEIDVDQVIAFRKSGYFGIEEKIQLDILVESEAAENTKNLLMDVYYGHTPQKKMESRILRQELRKDISTFKEYVREYNSLDIDEITEKEDLEKLIQRELSETAKFAAFKRWLIRDKYPKLGKFIPA